MREVLGTLLVFALTAASALGQGKGGSSPPATVVIGRVVEREEAVDQTFVGTLEPRQRSTVGSAVDGRVQEYPIEDGQWVGKGDELAGLLEESIKIEIRNAEAELAFRQAELKELVSGSLQEDKDQARAKRDASEAQYKYAKAKHSRAEALFQRGTGITAEDMDLAYSTLTAAEKNLEAAEAAWKLIEDWPRPEKRMQAQAKVDAQQAMVDQLEDRLRKFTIRAPFDGYIVTKHTEIGAWINRGDPIAEVISIDPIEAVVSLPESAVGSLQAAMTQAASKGRRLEAEVIVDALGEKEGKFVGAVDRIVPQADVRSRTFPVKLLIDNPIESKDGKADRPSSHKLKAGMICHVKLPGKRQKVTLVPKDAVVLSSQGARVMVVDETATPPVGKPMPVQMGSAYGSLVHVSSDQLKAGMAIITRGNERLLPGQPLNIVKEEK